MSINRRDFLRKTTAGVTVLGGGLAAPGSASSAHAALPVHQWREGRRPESPRRLSHLTHELARRAQAGEHGRAMKGADFSLDEEALIGMTQDMRYALATRLAAEHAPLRVLPHERIIGSATLREGPLHLTPAAGVHSVSHTTLGFDKVLHAGVSDLRRRIKERLSRGNVYVPERLAAAGAGKHGIAASTAGGAYWSARPLPLYHTPPLTVECLARVEGTSHYNLLVAHKDKSSPHHWELFTEAGTGRLAAYLPGYHPDTLVSDTVVTDGAWHVFALVFQPYRIALYVDGAQAASATIAPGAKSGSDDGAGPDRGLLYLGAYPPGGLGCHGAIETVRIRAGAHVPATPDTPIALDADTLALWRAKTLDGETLFMDAAANANHAQPIRRGGDLLESMLVCLDAFDIWRERHLALLDTRISQSAGDERNTYIRARDALLHVPENPPRSFHEAVQSLWFLYAFQRLMGTWSGIGRIDEMLWPYLEKDLQDGVATLDEAREILAHFWIKGCEWTGALSSFGPVGSGDAQHYQNIILAGIDRNGNEVCNPVTYLVLDIVEELHISDFPIAVRLNRRSPETLLRRIAEVQRHGGGIVAVYNEEVVIESLVRFGYPLDEARCFANDGCWEMQIPGKTLFSYVPFDGLSLLHETLGLTCPESPAPDYPDFETLYQAYLERLAAQLEAHHAMADNWCIGGHAMPLVAMFVDDCIERTRGYYDRGAKYNVLAPHIGGIANVADSLSVIRKLVYEDRYLDLPSFVAILRDDWQDHEQLRRLIRTRFIFYGNDNDQADAIAQRVYDDYTALAARTRERNGVLRPAGISTFGREIEWAAPHGPRRASPDGRRLGEVLATNCSPSPGVDAQGPTAVLNSYCKFDFSRCPNGATLELKIHPETVRGETGIDALAALLRVFVRQGGMFLHVDVVDSALLVDAQRHPEKYPNLAVRVAGWSARFATLNKSWQDMVIARTQQYV